MKYLIIPDVHGREFWEGPVNLVLENNPEAKIIFLGDYHDPYGYENIYKKTSIDNFKKIIELKEKNQDRVILLIGNHDSSYIGPVTVCECRHDYSNGNSLRKLFYDNHEKFQLVHRDGNILFSHAGIIPDWVSDYKIYFGDTTPDEMPNFLNEKFQDFFTNDNYTSFWAVMRAVGPARGGYDRAGSVVWADMGEHLRSPYGDYIQIFGHTQQDKEPVHYKDTYLSDKEEWKKNHEFYNLDCRTAFYLDDDNTVKNFDTNEVVVGKKTILNDWIW